MKDEIKKKDFESIVYLSLLNGYFEIVATWKFYSILI